MLRHEAGDLRGVWHPQSFRTHARMQSTLLACSHPLNPVQSIGAVYRFSRNPPGCLHLANENYEARSMRNVYLAGLRSGRG